MARNDLTRVLAQAGLEPITPREACTALDDTLAGGHQFLGTGRVNWTAAYRLLPTVQTPRLTALLPALVEDQGLSREEALAALAGMPAEEALQVIADTVTQLFAKVLTMPPEQLDQRRRLDEYGVDSLMATELLVTLRQQYDIDTPPMEILRSDGTIADLARIVHLRLGLGAAQSAG
ncbi:hypothetical protein VR41_08090 [Streptomyces sp. NRRL B-1568]|nr:hypothetical protein VR41_08090 [Streptomyces sp. NRRL B-1568]